MTHDQTTAVVVGASGILGPAGPALHALGLRTVGVSRRRTPQPDRYDESLLLDARDPDAVRRALAAHPGPRYVLAYAPAVTPESWAALVEHDDLGVLVATTSWADPTLRDHPWPAGGSTVLQLGWTGDPPRWHTPAEVSEAAVDALDLPPGSRSVLGRVRPWRERPG